MTDEQQEKTNEIYSIIVRELSKKHVEWKVIGISLFSLVGDVKTLSEYQLTFLNVISAVQLGKQLDEINERLKKLESKK